MNEEAEPAEKTDKKLSVDSVSQEVMLSPSSSPPPEGDELIEAGSSANLERQDEQMTPPIPKSLISRMWTRMMNLFGRVAQVFQKKDGILKEADVRFMEYPQFEYIGSGPYWMDSHMTLKKIGKRTMELKIVNSRQEYEVGEGVCWMGVLSKVENSTDSCTLIMTMTMTMTGDNKSFLIKFLDAETTISWYDDMSNAMGHEGQKIKVHRMQQEIVNANPGKAT